jgi:hypothetical protein
MTYRVMVRHEGVDKTGRRLSSGDVNCVGGDDTRVFYDRAEAESAFESAWATYRGGNPRADNTQMNFTKVSLYRYDGMNVDKNPEYTLIRFAQSEERISVEV